jgi:DNA-binding transcriptional ArsR family regulator
VTSAVVDDGLWSAIGDPTRRRLLDLLLAEGPGTATTLSAHLPVTRQAVTKHLVVLDRVARAVGQLNSVGASWDARLRRIKSLAEAIQQAKNN